MIGGMTLASDGYYALWRVDLDGKSSRDTGLSIRILNGYIQDKQLFYKT